MNKEKNKKQKTRIEKRNKKDKSNPTHKKDFERLIKKSALHDPKE